MLIHLHGVKIYALLYTWCEAKSIKLYSMNSNEYIASLHVSL